MSDQLSAIGTKLYEQADSLHNIGRALINKSRTRTQEPIIADWYPVIGATVQVLHNIDDIIGQIPDPNVSSGRYYDDRGPDVNPAVASTEATQALRLARAYLARVHRELNIAWSAIGHIGLRAPSGGSDQ